MKVLTIALNYPPQRYIGAELYDHALNKALIKEGHKVTVQTTEVTTEQYTFDSVPVNHPIEDDYDVIICHVDAYQQALYIRRVHNLLHIPLVGIQHNFGDETVKDEAFYRFDGIIYNSQHMLERSRNKTKHKIVLTPPSKMPSKLSTAGDKVMIVGTTKPKGVSVFYKLAQNLTAEKFIGVTGGWGTNHQLGYRNVEFVEPVADLKPYYLQAKVLLVPSLYESWSMAASEAMTYGVTVITFDDLPGVAENVGNAGHYIDRQSHWGNWRDLIETPLPVSTVKKQAAANYRRHKAQLKQTIGWLEELTTPTA